MSREKESYRDNVERISARYPNKELLSVKDVADYTGLNRQTVKKMFGFNGNYISLVKLARELS